MVCRCLVYEFSMWGIIVCAIYMVGILVVGIINEPARQGEMLATLCLIRGGRVALVAAATRVISSHCCPVNCVNGTRVQGEQLIMVAMPPCLLYVDSSHVI